MFDVDIGYFRHISHHIGWVDNKNLETWIVMEFGYSMLHTRCFNYNGIYYNHSSCSNSFKDAPIERSARFHTTQDRTQKNDPASVPICILESFLMTSKHQHPALP